jgi:flagellar motor protein MotB
MADNFSTLKMVATLGNARLGNARLVNATLGNKTRKMRSAALALGMMAGLMTGLSSQAVAQTSRQKVDWDNVSVEQQKALKASSVQAKDLVAPTQKHYVYQEDRRMPIEFKGEGAEAVFRIEGSGTDLRHSGRGSFRLASAKSETELKPLLEKLGLQLGQPLDGAGLVWMVHTPQGLAGLKALNQLKESGLAVSASPDWQRDIRKK